MYNVEYLVHDIHEYTIDHLDFQYIHLKNLHAIQFLYEVV